MKKKIIALLTISILIGAQLRIPLNIMGAESGKEIKEIRTRKDETIYINLDSGGELLEINAVNRIQTPEKGVYVDYGSYEEIMGLSKAAGYEVDGDKITWQLEEDRKGFYYQGRLDAQVPYIFKIRYLVDGIEVPPKDMERKEGNIKIILEAKPNIKVQKDFRDRYFYQIQTGLDLDRCKNIKAPGATSIISGRTQNLGFMLMPGDEDVFEIGFETEDFAFDGFTISSMILDIESMVDIDTEEIRDGFEKLNDASGKLVDGTYELESGMKDLAKGVKQLSYGAEEANSGLKKFKGGLSGYGGGISELAKNAKIIDGKLKELSQGGQALMGGFAQLKEGIERGLSQEFPLDPRMLPPELAQWLAQMGKQSQEVSIELSQYEKGLKEYTEGVSLLSAGMGEFYKGLILLEDSGGKLLPGLASIIEGMSRLTQGLSQTASKIQSLPGEVGRLVEGQVKLKDGLEEAKTILEDFDIGEKIDKEVISFVSHKNKPESLQFIYRTAEISREKEEKNQIIHREEKKGFLKRFLDLFKSK